MAPLPGEQVASPTIELDRSGPVTMDADYLRHDGRSGRSTLTGDVRLERADQRLRADTLRHDASTGRADARGDLRYSQTGLDVGAETGYLVLGADQGEMSGVRYLVRDTLTQGEAERIELLDADLSMIHGATYSTCRPGDEAWRLRAQRIRLDQASGIGEAWGARMDVLDTPVLYLPYVNFPLDDRRKSGVLPPLLRQSERTGTDLTVPVYWNIAPNYDATFRPRYMSRRGAMLGGEFRYLQPDFSGEIEGRVLPDDAVTGDNRWQTRLDHRHTFTDNLSGDLAVNRVSDDTYFRDFGTDLRASSTRHLESRAGIDYATPTLSARLDGQVYQTVDPNIDRAGRPYERLPRARVNYRPEETADGPRWEVDSEVVRFDHATPDKRITGRRMDIAPRVAWPLATPGLFATPALSLRHTAWDLDSADDPRTPLDSVADEQPSRTVPVASLDTGLILERRWQGLGRPVRQTLEPRLFYLYVPERDQSDLPRFDTGESVPGLFQFYSENRFIGRDRIGDANRLTTGLTSRFLDADSGREYLRLGVAQMHHFSDRSVVLRGEPGAAERRDRSDVIGEARVALPAGFHATGEVQWNPDADRTSLSGLRLSYRPRADSVITTGYRARRDGAGDLELEQRDITGAWPVRENWHVLGGWRYSMLEERTLESFGGLHYRDCCWGVRLLGRYFREEAGVAPERSIMVQFELRGLGTVGDDVQQFLEDSITGFGRRR